jgi:hypothetical protein
LRYSEVGNMRSEGYRRIEEDQTKSSKITQFRLSRIPPADVPSTCGRRIG